LVDGKFAIEVLDNYPIHFVSAKGVEKLMSRGRLVEEILGEEGMEYVGISLLEMEYAKNEAEYLLGVTKKLFE
jgi:hypothetical protein